MKVGDKIFYSFLLLQKVGDQFEINVQISDASNRLM